MRRVVKTSDVKPTKGRRIRIKRKSPVGASVKETPNAEPPADLPKSVVQSAIKKIDPPGNEVISDARMVITLRRNSKHVEEQGRRVSLGTDEAHFEPDYSDEILSERSGNVEKGKRHRTVGVMRSSSQDSMYRDENPDALALSDYSGFSNDESEKKQAKKKKKKKKKHRRHSQTSDHSEDETRRKRSQSYDDTQSDDRMSGDDKKRRKRRDSDVRKRHKEEKIKKKEAKKKHREEFRDVDEPLSQERRHKRDSHGKASRRDASRHDSRDRLRDGRKQSRDKKRKKEKRQKHRHRRESSSFTSDDVDA